MRSSTQLMLLISCFAVCVHADTVTVTNASGAGWVQISPNTFGLPADLSSIGCDFENETTCEPAGVFLFNVAFTTSGVLNILDSEGVSDQISFSNGSNGLGVVTFLSDPTFTSILSGGTTLCSEDAKTGCVQSFTIQTSAGPVVLTAASDTEMTFDPFGLGADSSDELQITSGATISSVPEPGAVVLFASGLLGVVGAVRRTVSA